MAVATVLSGEREIKADAYTDVGVRATQDAKTEKRKISESSGCLAALALPALRGTCASMHIVFGYFFGGTKKHPQGINTSRPCSKD